MLMLAFACWGPPTPARAGLCAAASVHLDFRAAKETSVGETGDFAVWVESRDAPRKLAPERTAGLGRAVCALLGLPGKLADVPLSATERLLWLPRACTARERSLPLGMLGKASFRGW